VQGARPQQQFFFECEIKSGADPDFSIKKKKGGRVKKMFSKQFVFKKNQKILRRSSKRK
jgi:hypothetical protein